MEYTRTGVVSSINTGKMAHNGLRKKYWAITACDSAVLPQQWKAMMPPSLWFRAYSECNFILIGKEKQLCRRRLCIITIIISLCVLFISWWEFRAATWMHHLGGNKKTCKLMKEMNHIHWVREEVKNNNHSDLIKWRTLTLKVTALCPNYIYYNMKSCKTFSTDFDCDDFKI